MASSSYAGYTGKTTLSGAPDMRTSAAKAYIASLPSVSVSAVSNSGGSSSYGGGSSSSINTYSFGGGSSSYGAGSSSYGGGGSSSYGGGSSTSYGGGSSSSGGGGSLSGYTGRVTASGRPDMRTTAGKAWAAANK